MSIHKRNFHRYAWRRQIRVGAVSNGYWMPFLVVIYTRIYKLEYKFGDRQMRKFQKEQAENFIQLLVEAHEEICANIEKKNYEPVLVTLADCQDGAIALGNLIESVEGEDCVTISFLEKYCELVFQIHTDISGGGYVDTIKVNKSLRKALTQIENSVRNDIKVRKEIVFFPYKASMWDSLESVYLAAKEEPDCDAYCVPIPYFDRNADGTFGKMYYEGGEYPKNIEIVSYLSYSLEERRPDVIYIHNPYDECNLVTSVHPRFYSSNLKKHTDKLVYIPYFVTPDVLPESFCIMPGCLNADIIIVQSEDVRNNYIEAFKQIYNTKTARINVEAIEKKIVALGSPKLEKAAKCEAEDYVLSSEWKKIISNTDGTKKTVIFYNTSLGTILNYSEKYLNKLREVLKLFRQREDVVLWWRPHPLSELTLSAMRPELFQEYKNIVREYQEEQWGIYDETTDLYRAIAWSDAYFGDRSSVTMLFTAAQKPVMIQVIENYTIAFENIVKANGSYWFTPIGYNALFKLDDGAEKAQCVGCFSKEQDVSRLYLDIVQYQDKLIFVPLRAETIALYDMNTGEFSYIPLCLPTEDMNTGVAYSADEKFTFAGIWKNNLYLFPATYPAIIKLDMESYEVEYLYEPIRQLNKRVLTEEGIYFWKGIIEDNLVKMWCEPSKAIVEFDMNSESLRVCKQLSDIDKYIEVVSDGKNYWLIPREKKAKLLKLSEDFQIIESILLPEGNTNDGISYLRGVCMDDSLLVFPGAAEHVMKVSLKDNVAVVTKIFDGEEEIKPEEPKSWKIFFTKRIDDEIVAFNQFSSELVTYHVKTGAINKKQINTDVNQKMNAKILLDVLALDRGDYKEEQSTYFYEENRETLQAYLELVQNCRKEMEEILLQKWNESKHSVKGTVYEHAGNNICEYVMTR